MKPAIVAFSAMLGILVDWRWPAIDRLTREVLLRIRGPLPAPDAIALVAIDAKSVARLGPFPWPRSRTAHVIDAIASAGPKVIALDIVYVAPTTAAEDDALAASIARAGNVVLPAEVQETPGSPDEWLLPLPEIASGAAALGHNRAIPAPDGVPRATPVQADAGQGRILYALSIETVRVGDRAPARSIAQTRDSLTFGKRSIPVDNSTRERRMAIDYIGPPGSFASRTVSFVDVIEGHVDAANFRNKYVLVGATASAFGQGPSSMSGIEVLANSVAAVLDSRFYTDLSAPAAIAFCLAVAAATAVFFPSRPKTLLLQIGILATIPIGTIVIGVVAFRALFFVMPVVSGLIAFSSTLLLTGLRRRVRAR